MMMTLRVQLLSETAKAPARQRSGDLGYDLYADQAAVLLPGEHATISTGIAIELACNVAGLVVPRSGLAAKHAVSVVNGPGLIDPGYRGTVGVVLINHGSEPFQVAVGDRIAQLLLTPVITPQIDVVTALTADDERGVAGFGSSGR